MRNFSLISPTTKSEVLSLIADGDEETRLIAGGTGLLNLIKQRLAQPERLVSLHKLDGLDEIANSQEVLHIGALAKLIDLEQHPAVKRDFPVLHEVLHEIASPRIRSMATVGGAVAHADPNQDLPLALLALDASVVVEASGREDIQIPVSEFYKDYFETALSSYQLVTKVLVPASAEKSVFKYKKFTPRSLEDYACVSVCVRLDLASDDVCEDARVVLGSVGQTVFRAKEAETLLIGNKVTSELATRVADAAASASDPIDDARGSADYKIEMLKVWVRRSVESAVQSSTQR